MASDIVKAKEVIRELCFKSQLDVMDEFVGFVKKQGVYDDEEIRELCDGFKKIIISKHDAQLKNKIVKTKDDDKKIVEKKVKIQTKSKTPEILKASDITKFYNSDFVKKDNDANNKIREEILTMLLDVTSMHPFVTDKKHGSKWEDLKEKFLECLEIMFMETYPDTVGAPEVYKGISIGISKKAGRSCHYDFEVSYSNNGRIVHKIPQLEFKKGSGFETMPQFMSLSVNSQAARSIFKNIPMYHEFHFEQYMPRIVSMYDDHVKQCIPNSNTYNKYVCQVTPTCHPFFDALHKADCLKDNEDIKAIVKKKNQMVLEGIDMYMRTYMKPENINMVKLQEKLDATQIDKTFLFWNNKQFSQDKLKKDDLKLLGTFTHKINKNDMCFVIEFPTVSSSVITVRLRWGNRQGILNPAWQIGFIPRRLAAS